MKISRSYLWILSGIAGIFLLQGCDSNAAPLGGRYDLSEYLVPESNGTLVYQLYVASKAKDESTFSELSYEEDVQYTTEWKNAQVSLRNKANEKERTTYTIESNRILVEEQDTALTYRFDREVNAVQNFVQETTIKETTESAGNSKVTYECNATQHVASMTIEPNPKEYTDLLTVECTRRNIIYASVGGKTFETIVERKSEDFFAKDQGMIQSEVTTCEYTRVDANAQEDDGCQKKMYKIWAFVAE